MGYSPLSLDTMQRIGYVSRRTSAAWLGNGLFSYTVTLLSAEVNVIKLVAASLPRVSLVFGLVNAILYAVAGFIKSCGKLGAKTYLAIHLGEYFH